MFNDAELILSLLTDFMPDTEQTFERNGQKLTLTKKGRTISLDLKEDEKEDEIYAGSFAIKEYIKDYTKNIDEIHDDVFVEALEEIKKKIDIKELDSLLKKDSFTNKEADKVMVMIQYSYEVLRKYLEKDIEKTTYLINRLY